MEIFLDCRDGMAKILGFLILQNVVNLVHGQSDPTYGTRAALYEALTESDDAVFKNHSHLFVDPYHSVIYCALLCSKEQGCLSFSFAPKECYCYDKEFPATYGLSHEVEARTFKRLTARHQCIDGFLMGPYGSICYKLMESEEKSWNEASAECSTFNSTLFMMNSQWKYVSYTDILALKQSYSAISTWWAGATDSSGTNKNWKWVNGQNVSDAHWEIGKPEGNAENCMVANVYFGLANNPEIRFSNVHCGGNHHFVCEITLI